MASLSTSHVEDTSLISPVLRISDRHLFIAVFLLALAIRIVLVFAKPDYRLNVRMEEVNIAISIAQHGTFADPFNQPTGLSAHSPPIYPFLLSFLIRLFGSGTSGSLAIALLTCVLSSLQYGAMIFLDRLGIPRLVCILTASWGALTPFQLDGETHGYFENTLSACVLIGLTLLTAAWLQRKNRGIWGSILFGLAWGIAIQISTSLLPVFAVWLAYGLVQTFRTEGKVLPYLRGAATAVITILVLLIPWTVRNDIQMGAPIWSRDNFGLDLYTSYDDCAGPTSLENRHNGCFYSLHPNGNTQELLKVRQLGEVEYNRQKRAETLTWIKTHPARFVNLTFFHFLRFWFVDFDSNESVWASVFMGYFWLLTVLGFLGLAPLLRAGNIAGWLLGTGMVAYSLIYYLHASWERYRYPIYWMTELLAVYAVVRFFHPAETFTNPPHATIG